MRNFVFRCPVTQLHVQGSVRQDDREDRLYVPQSCAACGGLHLVNPATGRGLERKTLSAATSETRK